MIALALFLALRSLNGYGDPVPWQTGETGGATLLSFLDLAKCPASADFLLITLSLGLASLAALEAVPAGRLARPDLARGGLVRRRLAPGLRLDGAPHAAGRVAGPERSPSPPAAPGFPGLFADPGLYRA